VCGGKFTDSRESSMRVSRPVAVAVGIATIIIFMGNIVAMPVYWYLHIWKQTVP
jgi:hypothetical protein